MAPALARIWKQGVSMNTIKFSNVNRLATERHDLEHPEIVETKIFGTTYKMYRPCNLNIFITNACHNRCDFCINAGNKEAISDDVYFDSLTKTLDELSGKGVEVTITGGEPTLDPHRFVKTLCECQKRGFKCRTVSTTGLLLSAEYEEKPLCEHLIETDFTKNINISRMSTDEIENASVFKSGNITNEDIKNFATFFNINGADMRVSCNLIPGYVDNMDKMLKFVDYYRSLDVQVVMFRELIGVKNSVKLDSIFVPDGNFIYIETLSGVYYDVDVYKYKDTIVKKYNTKKSADNTVLSSLSLRNGLLQKNFNETLKDFTNRGEI